jgi:hypothetical protein
MSGWWAYATSTSPMSRPDGRRHPCVGGTGEPWVVVELHGAMTPKELACACARTEALLGDHLRVRAHVRSATLPVIDVLARLRLVARREGAELAITGSCAELVELVGLSEALEVLGEAEPREQRGVEEVVDVRDPTA